MTYGDGTELPVAGRGAGVAFAGRGEDTPVGTAYGVAVGDVMAGAVVTGTAGARGGTGATEIGVAFTGAGAGAGIGAGIGAGDGASGRGGGSCDGVLLLPPGGGMGLTGASL